MNFGVFSGWTILLLLYLKDAVVLTFIVRNYGPVNALRKVPHMTAYFLRKSSTKN